MRQTRTRHNHLASVHHRAAAQCDHTLGVVFQGDFASFFDQCGCRLGVDAVEKRVPHPGLFQRLQDFLFVAEPAQGLVGDDQHVFVASLLANLADMHPCAVAFHDLRLRRRHVVNHLARQLVNLLTKYVCIH